MTSQDGTNVGAGKRINEVDVFLARNAEDVYNTFGFKTLDEEIRSFQVDFPASLSVKEFIVRVKERSG